MRCLTSLALLGLVVGCSPAAPPVETPKPPPPVASAKPVEAPHATWTFASSMGTVLAQIQLGERTLQIGERGRRWLFGKGEVEPKEAPTLASEDLVDGRAEGAGVLLVGEHGSVFVAKDPLGPIDVTRPGPKGHKAFAFRAGKQAVLGASKTGVLHRSADGGATWTEGKLPMRPGDTVVDVAANARGEVMVLLHPQRVLLSTDDGATFNPLATPGIGARGLRRDGKDDLILEGVSKTARLAAGKLEVGPAAPWIERKSTADKRPPRHALAGNRVVTLLETHEPKPSKKMKLEASVSAFGKPAGTPAVVEASVSRYARVSVAGYENTVVLGVYDESAESTKLVRTNDDGKTWEPVGTLEGRQGYGFRMWAGPGQIIASETCDDDACKPAQIKIGKAAWKELALPTKATVDAVELDPSRDRMWILATTGDGPILYAGKLSDGSVTATGVEMPKSTPTSATVDGKGWLRVAYDWPARIVRVAPDFGVHPTLYPPFDGPSASIGLVGDRGFGYDGDAAWETADGGEKWTRTAMGATGGIRCNEGGCLQGNAMRVGWDLPDPKKELVAATTTAPKKKDDTPEPSAKPSALPETVKLTCTAGGAWKTWETNPYQLKSGLDGDVRFASAVPAEDGSSSILVARGAAAPTKVQLLGPSPKKKKDDATREREWSQRTNEGWVAVRYSFAPGTGDSKYAPVDVELGWYSTATGKTTKTKLPKVSPFRVGRAGPSALHAVVEGGLLFLPNSGDAPMSFIREGGKVETMPRPPQPDEGAWSDALKHGNDILLIHQRMGDVTFALTKDAGKTWSTTTWSLGAPATVGMLDGKLALTMRSSMWGSGTPASLLTFEALTNDPPDALRLDPAKLSLGTKLEACTPKTRLGLYTDVPRTSHKNGVGLTVAPDKKDKDGKPLSLVLARVVDRVDAAGNVCNDALELEQPMGGNHAAIVSPHDLTHGWLLRANKDQWSKLEMRPLSCKVE